MEEKKQPADTSITFKTTKELKEDLQKVSELTGKTMTDIIISAITQEIIQYRNDNGRGRVQPLEAYRLTGISEYERLRAKRDGLTPSDILGKHKCFVLDEMTVNPSQPYYKVYDCESGQLIEVSKMQLEFKTE